MLVPPRLTPCTVVATHHPEDLSSIHSEFIAVC